VQCSTTSPASVRPRTPDPTPPKKCFFTQSIRYPFCFLMMNLAKEHDKALERTRIKPRRSQVVCLLLLVLFVFWVRGIRALQAIIALLEGEVSLRKGLSLNKQHQTRYRRTSSQTSQKKTQSGETHGTLGPPPTHATFWLGHTHPAFKSSLLLHNLKYPLCTARTLPSRRPNPNLPHHPNPPFSLFCLSSMFPQPPTG